MWNKTFRARPPMRNIWNNRLPRIIAPFRSKKRDNHPQLLFEEIRYLKNVRTVKDRQSLFLSRTTLCGLCNMGLINIIFSRCKNGLENLLRIMYSVVRKLILSGHLSIVATKGKASVVRHLTPGYVTLCNYFCNNVLQQNCETSCTKHWMQDRRRT